jgi:hypothetical protein
MWEMEGDMYIWVFLHLRKITVVETIMKARHGASYLQPATWEVEIWKTTV